ncbi:hypothetical protein MCEMIE22_02578 [Mycobacteriaceae bacterium]
MSPEAIVAVALGPNHLPGSSARKGVNAGARALWEAVDLTKEHSIARAAVAERGTELASLETAGNIYVATADAISSFHKSDTTEYTYVHLRRTSAVKIVFGDFVIQMPNGTPALGYHREMRRHPVTMDGPEVEAIVWPIPLRPAIYSIETGPTIGKSAGLIAVSEGKVAIVKRK